MILEGKANDLSDVNEKMVRARLYQGQNQENEKMADRASQGQSKWQKIISRWRIFFVKKHKNLKFHGH